MISMNHVHGLGEVPDDALDQLYPALVQCFGVILLGFFAGKFQFISEQEARGLSTFVGTFSLPALIFSSLCMLDLSSVQWKVVLAIFIAKALIFVAVIIVCFVVIKPLDTAKAGLFAIFVTQSNDFALGYPILKALYSETHPEFPMYLYLLAPISLLILNPLGFVLMEVGQNVEEQTSRRKRLFKVVRNVSRNPVVFMTFAGIIGNFIFKGSLPNILNQLLDTLGSAFSASALFLLGIRMVGKRSEGFGRVGLLTIAILVLVKTIALPIVSREVMNSLHPGTNVNETEDLSNFAFLYGTFPTAPSVFVFASQYDVLPSLIASAMVMSTFVSAPIMFISAKLLSVTDINPDHYIAELDSFLFNVSIIGLLASVWVCFVFLTTRRVQRMPHFIGFMLTISQAVACIGAILWSVLSCTHGWKLYVQFSFFGYGVLATRINTALLSVTILLHQLQSSVFVAQWKKIFFLIGQGIPLIIVTAMMTIVSTETPAHGHKVDPNFQYGHTQAAVALVVLVISFGVTVVSMILSQRFQRSREHGNNPARDLSNPISSSTSGDGSSRRLLDTTDTEEEAVGNQPSYQSITNPRLATSQLVQIEDIVDDLEEVSNVNEGADQCLAGQSNEGSRQRRPHKRYRCDSEHREYCATLLQSYNVPPAEEAMQGNNVLDPEDDLKLFRYTILLLCLSTSMFVGIAMCLWTLVMEKTSGLFLELVFLDGFLNFGQGLFSLALFGVDVDYVILPLTRFFRKHFYGADDLVLPPWEDLETETKQHCQQFLKYHIEMAMENLLKDITCQSVTHRAVFMGSEFVDWLIEVGLARNRVDAVHYGRHLVKGRVIRHIANGLDFYDDQFVYTFSPNRQVR